MYALIRFAGKGVRLAVCGLLAGLCLIAAAAGAASAEAYAPLSVDGYFACDIPAEWTREDALPGRAEDGEEIHGVTLSAYRTAQVASRIRVHFYAGHDAAMADFIVRNSRPQFVIVAGDSYGPVERSKLAGRVASVFEREKSEFVAPGPLIDAPPQDDGKVYEQGEKMARQVSTRERFVVVPAQAGFFVLRYFAPVEHFNVDLGVFEKVTSSFRPSR